MPDLIRFRRGTTSQWTHIDPILADGEPAFDLTTHRFRVGNGSKRWSELPTRRLANGEGAYDLAVRFGYNGSEEEWINAIFDRNAEANAEARASADAILSRIANIVSSLAVNAKNIAATSSIVITEHPLA